MHACTRACDLQLCLYPKFTVTTVVICGDNRFVCVYGRYNFEQIYFTSLCGVGSMLCQHAEDTFTSRIEDTFTEDTFTRIEHTGLFVVWTGRGRGGVE